MRVSSPDIERRKRRRRRRIQVIVIYTAIAVGLAWFFESQATTTVIFVRHAEKASMPADDPGLSPAGQRRVAELTRQLVDADVVAGVDAVYSTPYRRTEETARPIADKGKVILVVGHSNTLPALIGNMGASKRVPEIAEGEYDNIYIVSIPWFGKTKTIRLRYGEPYVP